jgi:hypothetical protein
MAEESADLCEGRALAEHLRGQRMTELMATGGG